MNLTESLELALEDSDDHDASLCWEQPIISPTRSMTFDSIPRIIDYGHTLPNGPHAGWRSQDIDAVLLGLHLSTDPDRAGAAICFGGRAIAHRWEVTIRDALTSRHEIEPHRAIAQLDRVELLSACQNHVLTEIWNGLDQAAGMPLPPLERALASPGLAHGIPVHVPDLIDPGTFYAYASREQTPIHWLPLSHPIHHRVISTRGASFARAAGAEHARWVIIPAGPKHTEEEILHAVLGVVKAAEYLGVRWITNPERARRYADLLVEWYGSQHDAFRPIIPFE